MTRQLRLVKLSIYLIALMLLISETQCQFFTRSSKSIPRMGRRSLPDYETNREAYKQMLADEEMTNEVEQADDEVFNDNFSDIEKSSSSISSSQINEASGRGPDPPGRWHSARSNTRLG